ncbi:MAG: LpxI family protein [Phycisphaeraceae bacterium]|nr:LpxI family protein [Phycisphaeraceae bacterium]
MTRCTSQRGPEPLGLIAGQGRLPALVIEGAHSMGRRVCAVGLAGQFLPELPSMCDEFHEVGLFRIASWARRLRRMGVREAVMVGRVDKSQLMHSNRRLWQSMPDHRALWLWYRRLRHDRRSAAVLGALCDELGSMGITLIDSTMPIPDHMATVGVMTRRPPSAAEHADMDFAWPLFQQMLMLGVGQSIAVRERDVIAVEAVEGTDRMIERAGQLCPRGGWTLCKGASADHDRRADVPTIGESTIRLAHRAGCRCIALASGDVILVDRPQTLAVADELGLAVVGLPGVASGR